MAEKKRREGSVITVTNDESAGVQMFTVATIGTLYLYHRPQADGPPGLSEHIKAHAAYHGMEQRIRDAGALGYDETRKRYATPQEKFDAMKPLVEYYNSGATEWNLRGGVSEGSLLFRAVMIEKADRDPVKVKEWIKGMDASTRRKMLDSDRLVEIVRELRKADGSVVDVDAIFNELDDLDAETEDSDDDGETENDEDETTAA